MKKHYGWIFLSLLTLSLGLANRAAYAEEPAITAVDPRNVTDSEYQLVWNNIDDKFTATEIADLKAHYKILFVPGFLNDALIDFGKEVAGFVNLGGYFDDQKTWLGDAAVGIPFEQVHVLPAATVEDNAKTVAKAINDSDRDVILITHSKGSVDSLDALLNQGANVKKVKGWISIQGAFFGSPVADFVMEQKKLRNLAGFILRSMENGTLQSLESLVQQTRRDYYNQNKTQIDAIVAAVPTLSFGSWMTKDTWNIGGIAMPHPKDESGLNCDGLVPWGNAILPNTDFVTLPDIDHAVTVMNCYLIKFDRVKFTKTLLSMLLRRMNAQSSKP